MWGATMADSDPVIDFWLDVQKQLQTTYDMPVDQARAALDDYRRRMASLGAINAVYHWEPIDVARAIHGQRFTVDPIRL